MIPLQSSLHRRKMIVNIPLLSTRPQLEQIRDTINNYLRLPLFRDYASGIPGYLLEYAVATARGAVILPTKDFVDVVLPSAQLGWQVKSLLEHSPLTWKRVPLKGDKTRLIAGATTSPGLKKLGDAIIQDCNLKARGSLNLDFKNNLRARNLVGTRKLQLSEIGYSCLMVFPDRNKATYFERLLITTNKPDLFNPEDYVWNSPEMEEKQSADNVSRSAYVGRYINGRKHFSWHGKTNDHQVHFEGDIDWRNEASEDNKIEFDLPTAQDYIDEKTFTDWHRD